MRRVTLPLLEKLPLSLPAASGEVDPGLSHHDLEAPADKHHEHGCAGKPGAFCCGGCRKKQPTPPAVLPNE